MARHVEPLAGVPVRWRAQRPGGRSQGRQPARGRREARGGSIAVFPPPHTFFWAREIAINLGYNWYRKDDGRDVLVRHPAGRERRRVREPGELRALQRAARARTQRMTVFLYPSADAAPGRVRRGAGVHARRSLQAAARLPGDEPSLSHGPRPAARSGRQPRRRDSRPRRAQGARHQHRQPDRLGPERRGRDTGRRRCFPGASAGAPRTRREPQRACERGSAATHSRSATTRSKARSGIRTRASS